MTSFGLLFFLAAGVIRTSLSNPITSLQTPLQDLNFPPTLHGRFLHITDLHPDPYYKAHTSTEEQDICHRERGVAGIYGAEKSDCDSPEILINATFKWIKENLKGEVDFVIYTGDSSRHENDALIPRTPEEVLDSNRWIMSKFLEVFGQENNPNEFDLPVISTLGNNDILPHNVVLAGPNEWLHAYSDIWSSLIPKDQRKSFQKGGWYHVEVIPDKLAVFSLNTLYFFSRNGMLNGCAEPSEPGFEHFEWLRVQLQNIRERGMKAIIIGHVPPARTSSKALWRESCWQKYTLWLHQYRDIVIGGIYGHMNIDHFLLHDTQEINNSSLAGISTDSANIMEDEFSTQSAKNYLSDLREQWAGLPLSEQTFLPDDDANDNYHTDSRYKKIGGLWGERYQVTLVSPSVVPNYLPSLRVIEYNISGLDLDTTWARVKNQEDLSKTESITFPTDEFLIQEEQDSKNFQQETAKSQTLLLPSSPTKGSPPGPAYSPQTLTFLGYTQYYANLTHINSEAIALDGDLEMDNLQRSKRLQKSSPRDELQSKSFSYQIEYQTFTDPVYKLKDMTVRSFLRLAHQIGQNAHLKKEKICSSFSDEVNEKKYRETGRKSKTKHRKHRDTNMVWLQFIQRAFVGTLEEEDLEAFHSE
ncbi:Endopolyphosphatase [Podosphaera aphanis]|nr:Endopolyphosphatase [Podosphaera aphanis]